MKPPAALKRYQRYLAHLSALDDFSAEVFALFVKSRLTRD
jgi:hypothetical protein